MTVATDTIKRFNECIDDFGEQMTLRHFEGRNVSDADAFDEIYSDVDTTMTNTNPYDKYTDYTVMGMNQPVILPSREQRIRHTAVGYVEQGKRRVFIKATDISGTALVSRKRSSSSYNIDENDYLIIDSTTYIVNQVNDWEISGTIIYYDILVRIDIDEVEM